MSWFRLSDHADSLLHVERFWIRCSPSLKAEGRTSMPEGMARELLTEQCGEVFDFWTETVSFEAVDSASPASTLGRLAPTTIVRSCHSMSLDGE